MLHRCGEAYRLAGRPGSEQHLSPRIRAPAARPVPCLTRACSSCRLAVGRPRAIVPLARITSTTGLTHYNAQMRRAVRVSTTSSTFCTVRKFQAAASHRWMGVGGCLLTTLKRRPHLGKSGQNETHTLLRKRGSTAGEHPGPPQPNPPPLLGVQCGPHRMRHPGRTAFRFMKRRLTATKGTGAAREEDCTCRVVCGGAESGTT